MVKQTLGAGRSVGMARLNAVNRPRGSLGESKSQKIHDEAKGISTDADSFGATILPVSLSLNTI